MLGTLFGKLEGRFYCVGSVVLKRKQQLDLKKAEKAGGILVDLPPTRLEGFALELLVKRLKCATSKQFHLGADGDMKVIYSSNICFQHSSPTSVTNIRHQHLSPTSVTNICHQHLSPTSVTNICH